MLFHLKRNIFSYMRKFQVILPAVNKQRSLIKKLKSQPNKFEGRDFTLILAEG